MTVSKEKLLQQLPPYTDEWVKVKEQQRVPDIIKLICERHSDFAGDYDAIGSYFIGANIEDTCDNLYNFCKENLQYKEETESVQTVGNPASILSRGAAGIDCKSYACFIGGCLDAIQRATGQKIKWYYRFASYDPFQKIPYHVFVVVDADSGQLYVDPTPGSEDKEPIWVIDRTVKGKKSKLGVVGGYTVGTADTSNAGYGILMPAPAWYPANLPKYYKQSNGDLRLLPEGKITFSENDVMDNLLYLQTIVGYNRTDYSNARSAAWFKSDGKDGFKMRVENQFNGVASGNMAWVPSYNVGQDGTLYSKLQARYIVNESKSKPWLSSMQAKGGGIDLMTIPMANDVEVPRPAWYADYLPSLYFAAGNPGQYPAGHLDTKPKLNDWKASSSAVYDITPDDIAMYMVYAQPVIYSGATPYPLNWFINDDVNGAMASWYKITLSILPGHTNSQMQTWGITGDIMQQPMLDANPFASGFTTTLESIVNAAVNFFAGKIPGGTKAVQAAYAAGSISGGTFITGGPVPSGVFSAAVFAAADALITKISTDAKNKKIIIFGIAAAVLLGWYYQDDLKKMEFSL